MHVGRVFHLGWLNFLLIKYGPAHFHFGTIPSSIRMLSCPRDDVSTKILNSQYFFKAYAILRRRVAEV